MRHTTKLRTAILTAAVGSCLPLVSRGQTSASWIFNGDGNWSDTTKWSGGAFPDGGGVASFTLHPLQAATRTITLDTNVTLNGLSFQTAYQWIIAGTANSITLTGPVNIAVPFSNASSPALFAAGDVISRPLIGSSGLVKNGNGNLTLTATNTYTGGTTINAGILRTTVGDLGLGAPGAANSLTFDGGTLRPSGTTLSTARNVILNAGGGTMEMFAAGTFSGVVSGGGNLTKTISSSIAFQSANTYSGSTNQTNLGSGTIIFQNAGSALSTSAINSNGTINLDNATTNSNDRLPSVAYALQGGGLNLTGNAGAATSEALGAVTVDTGQAFVTVTPNAAQNAQMTWSSWTRSNRSTLLVRGTNLGNAPAVNVANVFMTSAPALVGGGGAAGSTNISIIQGASGGTTTADTGSSFLTYGATGVRPLAVAEYNTMALAGATDNVRVTAATPVAAPKTINSLVIATGAGVSGAGPLTVTSGQVIQSTATTTANTVNLDFGGTEGVFTMASSGTFDGAITGSQGITKAGASTLFLRGAVSSYQGDTTISNGSISFNANVPVNTNSAFGNSNDPIIIEPGQATTSLILNGANANFDRNLIVRGNGTGIARIGTTGVTEVLTFNGKVQVDHPLTVFPPSTTVPITFNGKVSGSSRITNNQAFAGQMVFNGDNDWTGGIDATQAGDIWLAGHDHGFGTGTLFMAAAGSVSFGSASGAHTFANPLTFVGGNLNIPNTNPVTFTGPVNLGGGNSGASDGPWTFTVPSGGVATFTGQFADGGITKAGTGKMIVSGANIYTGGTAVTAGILQVDNLSGSGTGTNFVTVASGATLAGKGTIAGPVSIASGGNLSPGDSPGTLASGDLTLNNTTGLLYELDTPGIVDSGINDFMMVNGNLVLDGVLTVTGGGNFGPGTYTLMMYSAGLTDNTVTVNPLPSGFTGSIDTVSQPGKVLLNVVPEPGTAALLLSLTGAALTRRRRRES